MAPRSVAALALPALVAFAAYTPYFANPLLYDDARAIRLLASGSAPDLWPPRFGRALTWLLFRVEYGLWGETAIGYHVVSAALHGIASALAASLVARCVRSATAGLVGGLLFALHPVHSEVVASFANNKDALAFVLVAASALAWMRSDGWDRAYFLSLASYALALFAKEVAAVALPAVLLLHQLLDEREPALRTRLLAALPRTLPFLAVAGGASAVFLTSDALDGLGSAREAIRIESNGRLQTGGELVRASLGSVGEQLRLLTWPIRLSADYPQPTPSGWLSPRIWVGIGAWLSALVAVLLFARRAPWAAFGVAWTTVFLLPVSNLVPLIHHFVAERYLYVPSFGVCLVVAGSVARARGGLRIPLRILAALVLALAAWRVADRAGDWSSRERLWSAVLAEGLETPRAHNALASWHLEEGRPERAIEHFERSAELVTSDEAFYQLGFACARAGRERTARRHLRRALAANPRHDRARQLLDELSSSGVSEPADVR